jgi:DNA primase
VIITLDEVMTTGRGTERPFNCPDHDDTNASASVNVLKGVWYCYSCHSHGLLEDHVPSVDEALAVLAGSIPTRVMTESWLDLFDADHASSYWVERFGIEVAAANRCGTDPLSGFPTYPLRDDQGRIVGVVTRDPDARPKYRYPWNVSTSRTLYGVLRPSRVVVLLEGAADVMSLQQAVLPSGWAAVGVFGSGLHYPQVEIVARLNPTVIVAAFDNDKAGRDAAQRAHEDERLTDVAPVVSHRWSSLRGASDPAELPPEDRIPALRNTLRAAGFGDI